MNHLWEIQNKLVPEMIIVAEKRYNILKEIQHSQPIGRRYLAEKLNESERGIRNEIDFLKDMRFIDISAAGASLTVEGKELLSELDDYIKALKGISALEVELQKILAIPMVCIVPASQNREHNKRDLGRFAAKELKRLILKKLNESDPLIIAVTGGTTMADVANSINYDGQARHITVVPGRGGLGEDVEIQANAIAANIAKKLGGNYRMLHLPDSLHESTLHSLSREPQVKEVMDLLAHASILIHGVGTAHEMAKRRGLGMAELKHLDDLGAVGEAFGFYFNAKGESVLTTTSVGLRLDDLRSEKMLVVAIAGGEEKAAAILSVVSPIYHDVLITDEETARQIIELKKS